jgi:uncharacterized protein (TIGR02271 family)
MRVRDSEGEPLGVVRSAYNGQFTVSPAPDFPDGLILHHDDIRSLNAEELVLMRPREELLWVAAAASNDEVLLTDVEDRQEMRIPLLEEEVLAERVAKPSGQVRVRKRVITEEKTFSFTVPVRREELVIEQLPAAPPALAAGARGTAQPPLPGIGEGTLTVRLHEERVELQKRAYVYEEVVITKEVVRETRRLDVPVRREVARVRGESELCWEDE